jgi:periodic tryptophan protein 1
MSMITATTWVPRGFAAPFPTKYQFDDDEYDRISKLANLQLEDAKEELEEAQAEAEDKSNGTPGKSSKKKQKDDEYVFWRRTLLQV